MLGHGVKNMTTWHREMRKEEYVFKGSFNMKENPIMISKMLSENSTYTLWFAYCRVVLEKQFCEFKMVPSEYLIYIAVISDEKYYIILGF